MSKDDGGRFVREVWIEWAREQPDIDEHPHWLTPWEKLSERDREVDRRIAERLTECLIRERDDARASNKRLLAIHNDMVRRLVSVACATGKVFDDPEGLAEHVVKMLSERTLWLAERDEARAVLRKASTWMRDACDLISSAIPDASSWYDKGGLADRSDTLDCEIVRALGERTTDERPPRSTG